jgi:hypothetical protein
LLRSISSEPLGQILGCFGEDKAEPSKIERKVIPLLNTSESVYRIVLSSERNEPFSEGFSVDRKLQVKVLCSEPPSCSVVLALKQRELLVTPSVFLGTAKGYDVGFPVVDDQIAPLGFADSLAISVIAAVPGTVVTANHPLWSFNVPLT